MAGKKGMQVHIRPISSSIVLWGVSGRFELVWGWWWIRTLRGRCLIGGMLRLLLIGGLGIGIRGL